MPLTTNSKRKQDIERLINRAVTANRRAKESDAQTRAAFYRDKNAAICALLIADCAVLDGVDWAPSPAAVIRAIDPEGAHTRAGASAQDCPYPSVSPAMPGPMGAGVLK
jgi:hypothetical protein